MIRVTRSPDHEMNATFLRGTVHLLNAARARFSATCCLAVAATVALASCGGDLRGEPDAGSSSADRDAMIAVDAQTSPGDDGGHSEPADAGPTATDASAPDSGPPPPMCPSVACASVEGTTPAGRLRDLDECAFGLQLEDPLEDGEALADALLARLTADGLGTRRDVAHVRANLNRDGRSGLNSATSTRLAGLSARGFRWNTGDDAVDYWYPQGITGSADAELAGASLLLVSWYHKTDARPTKGARLSLVDISNLAAPTYRHLLLVDPFEDSAGRADFGPAEYDSGGALHAGGIAWIGDYLYVADTSQGLRIYDLSRMFAPTHADDTERVGIGTGRSDAHGYAYAVPRIGRYVRGSGTCASRFSFVARGDVDGAPALITGEYIADSPNGRLVAWPLDASTGLLTGSAVTYASGAAIGGQTRIQGALRVGDAWYMSSSSQDGSNGRLYLGRDGVASTSVAWIRGCEDLYRDESDRIWTVGEHPGARDVVSIPRPRP